MFDPIEVYIASTFVGSHLLARDIVTSVQVVKDDSDSVEDSVGFVAMRSNGPISAVYPTSMIEGEGDAVVAYRSDFTKLYRLPVKVVYEPLTLESFESLRDFIEGYDTIVAQTPTDAHIRAWYREALAP